MEAMEFDVPVIFCGPGESLTFRTQLPSLLGLFFVSLILSCGYSTQKSPVSSAAVEKIPITRDQVYDLSGYAGKGGGNPYCLFDENAFVDPRYEKNGDGFIPSSNCQPTIHPAIYFSKQEGSRIVVNLKVPYLVTEIYLYDHSHTPDSCWIYAGGFNKWKKISSFVTASGPGAWGWKKISLSEETRFLMIRFSSYETAITEMVLYGKPTTEIPAPPVLPLPPVFTRSTLDQFLGVNYIMEKEPAWLKPFHYSRLYNFALDYDNDSTQNENRVRFNMLHYGYYNQKEGKYIFDIDTLQHINQGNIWFSIRGVSKWMSDRGFTDKDRPLNHPFLNTEDPASYSRHAEMMWHLAAFFGYQKTDTGLLSLSNEPLQTGRGSMHLYENGNEEDADWVGDKYCSPYEYFAQSSADWDGDEGRLGRRHGIHSADSAARLMMSGLTSLDTNRVKVYGLLSENIRQDHQFIWKGGIQYHYYCQKNGKGISPEEDSLRRRLAGVADCSHRIAPGIPCFLGENGYDKAQTSWQATPLIPGMSVSQSQGVMLLRSVNAVFFSGFDAYILYWLRDGKPENDPGVYLTSGILRSLPDGKTIVYPGWYYISTMVNRLGKYRPDRVIRESADGWIYRYRNSANPDSVAYFVYKPTVDGSHISFFSLAVPDARGNAVLKVDFAEETDQGREEKILLEQGKIRLTVEEKPCILFCKEPAADK